MSDLKIRITIGSKEDAHDVSFSEFARVVKSSHALLEKIAMTVFGEGHDCDFLLSDLSHNSPASMDIALVSESQPYAAQDIVDGLKKESRVLADGEGVSLPDSSFKVWRSFLSPCVKNKVSMLTIQFVQDGDAVVIMRTNDIIIKSVKKIPKKVGMPKEVVIREDDVKCQTSVVGKVELLNFHERQYMMVFPRVKSWNPVKVYFEEDLRDEVIECVNKYAEIFGMGTYRSGDALPYEMAMDEIQQLPDEEDMPKFSEMRGIAPNITGDKSVQEYLDDIRKEWD